MPRLAEHDPAEQQHRARPRGREQRADRGRDAASARATQERRPVVSGDGQAAGERREDGAARPGEQRAGGALRDVADPGDRERREPGTRGRETCPRRCGCRRRGGRRRACTRAARFENGIPPSTNDSRRMPALGHRVILPAFLAARPARPGRTMHPMPQLLVVEDDAAIAAPLVRALRREGYEVDARRPGRRRRRACRGVRLRPRAPRPRPARRRRRRRLPRASARCAAAADRDGHRPPGGARRRRRSRRRRRRLRHQAVPARGAARPGPGASARGAARPRRCRPRRTCASTSARAAAWRGRRGARPDQQGVRPPRAAGPQGRSPSCTREQIMEEVWDEHWFGSTKTLDVHVSWLRRKLGDDPATPRYITTVRGVGLRFERGPNPLVHRRDDAPRPEARGVRRRIVLAMVSSRSWVSSCSAYRWHRGESHRAHRSPAARRPGGGRARVRDRRRRSRPTGR